MKKIFIVLLTLCSLASYGQNLINTLEGTSQNVVLNSAAAPVYNITVNFTSRSGWTASDVVAQYPTGNLEYSVEFLETIWVFTITNASINGSGSLDLELTKQDAASLLLFPTVNGTIQLQTNNFGLVNIDAASSDDEKAEAWKNNMYIIDSLLLKTNAVVSGGKDTLNFPSHGITLDPICNCRLVTINGAGTGFEIAKADVAANVPFFMIEDVVDTDNLVVGTSGTLTVTHGLPLLKDYWVQDDGTYAQTNGTIQSFAFQTITPTTLYYDIQETYYDFQLNGGTVTRGSTFPDATTGTVHILVGTAFDGMYFSNGSIWTQVN